MKTVKAPPSAGPRSVLAFVVVGFVAVVEVGGNGGCAHPRSAPSPRVVPATKPDHELAVETGIPVASTPQGLMQHDAATKLQERLIEKGLMRAEQRSGQLDAATMAALRTFQASEGLPATGLPSYETIDHLDLSLDAIFHPASSHPASSHARGPTAGATGP